MARKVLTEEQRRKRRLVLLVIALVVVGLSVLGFVLAAFWPRAAIPAPAPSPTALEGPSSAPTEPTENRGDVVDPTVADNGLLPEPITSDPKQYAEQAVRALFTYDTAKVSRQQFVDSLAEWYGSDPLRNSLSQAERDSVKQDLLMELGQSIVLPDGDWDAQTLGGVVATSAVGDQVRIDDEHLEWAPDAADRELGRHVVTVDVDVTYTGDDSYNYTEKHRVSVQVSCGQNLPEEGRQPQDCRLIRYFDEAFK